jgi:hypothetical protein
MMPSDIAKLHIADLNSKYSFQSQGLDLMELLAIYASIPYKFDNDHNGKKASWRATLETNIKNMLTERENGKLSKEKERNPVYELQKEPPIEERENTYSFKAVSSKGAFSPRDSFKSIKKNNAVESNENNGGGVIKCPIITSTKLSVNARSQQNDIRANLMNMITSRKPDKSSLLSSQSSDNEDGRNETMIKIHRKEGYTDAQANLMKMIASRKIQLNTAEAAASEGNKATDGDLTNLNHSKKPMANMNSALLSSIKSRFIE